MKLTISRSLHPCLDKCYKWTFRETPVTLWQSHQPENISPVFELTNIRLLPIPDLSLITTQPETHKKILAIRQKSLEGKKLPHLTDAEVFWQALQIWKALFGKLLSQQRGSIEKDQMHYLCLHPRHNSVKILTRLRSLTGCDGCPVKMMPLKAFTILWQKTHWRIMTSP